MNAAPDTEWIDLTPAALADGPALQLIIPLVTDLMAAAEKSDDVDTEIAVFRRKQLQHLKDCPPEWRLGATAAIHVFADLIAQGWTLRLRRKKIEGLRPSHATAEDVRLSKRHRLLVRRNEQLREAATRDFIRTMESGHFTARGRTTIFSLMRDGRDLANLLSRDQDPTKFSDVVDPYIQFVTSDGICAQTGFSLQDIWRYFRHTWSNPYGSVPGRSMLFLVRDRATPFHCVMGIGALSSAAIQLDERDAYIGWYADDLLVDAYKEPSSELADWLLDTTHKAIEHLYVVDFVKDEMLPSRLPTTTSTAVLESLKKEAKRARDAHHRRAASKEHKRTLLPNKFTDEDWEKEAKTELFRSKRAQELAKLLELRNTIFDAYKGRKGEDRLSALLSSSTGRNAFLRVVKAARSITVGTAIADLTICGAVPPYNELLGGKLVAMLAASPAVVREYKRRYSTLPSVIASSMAGKRTVRPADLVFIGTTSLYGVRPNQYDRVVIPASIFGKESASVAYKALGERTEGVGTFQFSKQTQEALETFFVAENSGRRVNNVFGEGANPKLRALRDGLARLGFDSDALLTHGLRKTIYGVNLVTNLREYLLGFTNSPYYRLLIDAPESDNTIGRYWLERWVIPRLKRPDLLGRLRAHTLVHPIRHGARVVLPDADLEQLSFRVS